MEEYGKKILLGNYKQPLQKVEEGKGYGYYGVVLETETRDEVQCHICGEWFMALNGQHLRAHGTNAKEYRKTFNLSSTTKLISEKARLMFIERYNNWFLKRSKKWREDFIERLRNNKKGKSGSYKLSLEARNKRGICPQQILAKIKEAKEELGHTPSVRDFKKINGDSYFGPIVTLFGSWSAAVRLAGYVPQSHASKRKYGDKELLGYLKNITKKFKKIPTSSDYLRGAMPAQAVYKCRFGSFERAKELAGVYEMI